MSYFVTVTFDLEYASASPHGINVYRKITDALDAIDYSRMITGKKNRVIQLPANTYVAEFEEDGADHSREIVDFVEQELRAIFSRYHVQGRFFVCAGKGWAWKTDRFKP